MWFELVAVIVCALVVAGVLAVMGARTRALAGLGQSLASLRRFSDGIATHASDNADKAPGYSWKKGDMSSGFADLRNPPTDLDAAAYQAVDIIRRRSGIVNFPKTAGWVPHIQHVHLPLADYLNAPLPLSFAASAEDRNLLKWAGDPTKWQQNGAPNERAPFRSSYEWAIGLWALTDSGTSAISQDGLVYSAFSVPTATVVGQRTLSSVTYPAFKAEAWEIFQRFFGPRQGFFMYDEARVPVVAFDGSASLRAGRNTNNGWKPQAPTNTGSSSITYQPGTSGDPPALGGGASDTVKGKFRWTRKTVAGRDFDAGEVN